MIVRLMNKEWNKLPHPTSPSKEEERILLHICK